MIGFESFYCGCLICFIRRFGLVFRDLGLILYMEFFSFFLILVLFFSYGIS